MRYLFLALATLSFFTIKAQVPELTVPNTQNDENPVILQKLSTEVQILGNIAITTSTMTFLNKGSRVLEGNLTFPLPEGATVSKYALDINGTMRNAVPVEKAKAAEVFESIEHRNIDPGILEKVEGNNFRTRIFPFPVGGTRTISISYEQSLGWDGNQSLRYHLPLNYKNPIADFSLKVTVFSTAIKPTLTEQPDGSFSFNNTGNAYIASLQKSHFTSQRSLTINLPKNNQTIESLTQLNEDGSAYFFINDFPKSESRQKIWGNHIGIIWDASLSGRQRDHEKELALIAAIVAQKQNMTITLGLLNNTLQYGGTYTITNGNWNELQLKLKNISYDGATDFSVLQLPYFVNNILVATMDEFLFFTDGMSSFGDNQINIKKPIHTVSAVPVSDFSALKNISNKNGGLFINLNTSSVSDAFNQLSKEHLQFLGIAESSATEVYPNQPTQVATATQVTGLVQGSPKELTLLYGWAGKITVRKKVPLQYTNKHGIDVHRVWAQQKIAALDVDYEKNKEDITLLGKQFGLVTRNTSLIVLEDIYDYVRYDITPPQELLEAYNRIKKENGAAREERIHDLLEQAVSMTQTLKDWWKTDFKAKKYFPRPVNKVVDAVSIPNVSEPPPPPPPQADRAQAMEVKTGSEVVVGNSATENMIISDAMTKKEDVDATLDEVVLVKADPRGRVAPKIIEIPDFKSDKDYIKVLQKAKRSNAYQTYLQLREDYISTPSFYFDVANWFFRNNSKDTALMVLSNIAELSIEDAPLYKMLAYKLKQIGAAKKQLWISKKVLDWRPMDPQSIRDYALALQDNGRYQQALDMLYSILTQTYSPEAANRDEGIEEVIVMEINQLIRLYRSSLDISKIDNRLITALPVDIRVVLNWNKADTDIDLWVLQPNGEKCYYGESTTTAGGRISNDFTDGFGPEQFLLKKAIKGKYKIETNFFAESELTISGPTTLMAEIFLYYADGSQSRKIITLQSNSDEPVKDSKLIGEFTF